MDLSGSHGGTEKQLNSGYYRKIKWIGFADGFMGM